MEFLTFELAILVFGHNSYLYNPSIVSNQFKLLKFGRLTCGNDVVRHWACLYAGNMPGMLNRLIAFSYQFKFLCYALIPGRFRMASIFGVTGI